MKHKGGDQTTVTEQDSCRTGGGGGRVLIHTLAAPCNPLGFWVSGCLIWPGLQL